jgi:hypothetical protein
MNLETLKVFGQIAGLAGLSLGVVLILFREIIRKKIFPDLTREHAYRLLRLIVVLVWSIAVIGIGSWSYSNNHQTPAPKLDPKPIPEVKPSKIFVNDTIETATGEMPSGAHADYSPPYSLCSDNQPDEWNIVDSTFWLSTRPRTDNRPELTWNWRPSTTASGISPKKWLRVLRCTHGPMS